MHRKSHLANLRASIELVVSWFWVRLPARFHSTPALKPLPMPTPYQREDTIADMQVAFYRRIRGVPAVVRGPLVAQARAQILAAHALAVAASQVIEARTSYHSDSFAKWLSDTLVMEVINS